MGYGYTRNASALYQQNSVRGGIEDADPHQLIGLLLDGAIDRISQARGYMTRGEATAKGQCISRVIAIIAELRESLDHKVQPGFSGPLDALYDYITRRLLYAQLHDDVAALDESIRLLMPVRDGWQAIRGSYLDGRQKMAGAA